MSELSTVAGGLQAESIYVAKKDFWGCGSRHTRRPEKGAYIRPAGINNMGGYYSARTKRVDLLD